MKGFIVSLGGEKWHIERDVEYDDSKVVDDLYYRVGNDLIPCAYLYPELARTTMMEIIADHNEKRKEYEAYKANIFYKVLPTLRKFTE